MMNWKPGDWTCCSCQFINFSRRDSCMRCSDPRPGAERSDYGGFSTGGRASSFSLRGSDLRPGDWYCDCGAHNFASRSSCFMCGAPKKVSSIGDSGGGFVGRSSGRRGDWICSRSDCNFHNFASRVQCLHCCAPRDNFSDAQV